MKNGINDKEVNLENTNKHTKIQKLFSSKLFQIFFFIFLFLLIFYSFQILLSSIEYVYFLSQKYDEAEAFAIAFAYIGFILIFTAVVVLPLTLFSTIIFFKQTKKFILFKTNFKFSFYILFFICIYSVSMIIATNTEFLLIRFFFKDFSIYKMLICIIIALITTFSFKKLINFTLKDKK